MVFFKGLNALFLNLLHFLQSRQLFEMLVNMISMHDIQNFKIHVLEWQFSLFLNYFAVLISFLHAEDPNLKWNSSYGVNSTRTEPSWKLFLYFFFQASMLSQPDGPFINIAKLNLSKYAQRQNLAKVWCAHQHIT